MAKLSFRLVPSLALAFAIVAGAACSDSSDLPIDEEDSGTTSSSSSGSRPQPSSSSSSGPGPSDPTYAEAPVLSVIEPTRATVGSAGPTIVVRGRNFVERTIVQLDGAELQTSFIDTTELRATLPTDRLTTPGTLIVTVGTSPPGGGASSAMEFTVENPVPTLTRISDPDPPSVRMGSAGLSITLEGAGFVPGAAVRWAGTPLPTTVNGPTSVTAQVDEARVVNSGIFELDVQNPTPGGGGSAKLTFTVTNPTVTVSALDPASTTVGSGATPVTLTGTGFVSGKSLVVFNTLELVPTVTSSTELTVLVPANQLATVGDLAVVVQNPNPGGGVSIPRTFRVVNPAPRMTSLNPSSAVQTPNVQNVQIIGENFVSSSKVTINGNDTFTTVESATSIRFTLPAGSLATAGAIDIRVENPSPGGGNARLPFNVRNGQPIIDDVIAAGVNSEGFLIGRPVAVSVRGNGFLNNSVINVNNVDVVPTTFVSSTELQATLTPSVASLTFKVKSTSASDSNSIVRTACGSLSAGAYPLPNTNVLLKTNPPLFGAATATVFAGSGSQCGVAGVNFRSPQQPYAAFIVQNTSGRAAVLEAWADCAGPLDDAYLALYKRSTPPVTEAQRETCEGRLSNGGEYPSLTFSNTGQSNYCPGLVSGRGAQPITACETWVAYIQQDTTTAGHTPPQALNIDLWQQ